MIQFMEEAEKMEEQKMDQNGEDKDCEQRDCGDKNKESKGENVEERTSDINNPERGGSTSRKKVSLYF